MICDHIDGGLNDGPCHNTIHCICEEGLEDLVRYDEGQCPEPDWAGWYTLAFLLGFFFWLCAIYGCAPGPADVLHAQGLRQRLVLGHRALLHPAHCALEHIVVACYGMNAGIHVLRMVGAAVGFRGGRARGVHAPSDGSRRTTNMHQTRRRWRWFPSCLRSNRSCRSKFRRTRPGMPVQVRIPDGRIVNVPIPAGMPGQIISVAVPAPAPTSVSSEAIPVAEGALGGGRAGRRWARNSASFARMRSGAATSGYPLARVPSRVPPVAPRPGAPVLPYL